jgi:hypothetical protein
MSKIKLKSITSAGNVEVIATFDKDSIKNKDLITAFPSRIDKNIAKTLIKKGKYYNSTNWTELYLN